MHEIGLAPNKPCHPRQVEVIRAELGCCDFDGNSDEFPLRSDRSVNGRHAQIIAKAPDTYQMGDFVDTCRAKAIDELEEYLIDLAINPEGTRSPQFLKAPEVAIESYLAQSQQRLRDGFVPTATSKEVFRTLDRGLRSRGIVVVQGVEGVGKSFSAEAWCDQHMGEARFVRLEGIVNRTTFFQAISKSLGLAAGVAQKSHEMQIRIRQHLERSGIMLVIDEAHRLFPQVQRIYCHPELLNWIYTLWDFRVPVALIVTPQFVTRMDAVEKQTDWRSGQFKRRVVAWKELPEKHSESDLRVVTRKIAPAAFSDGMVDDVVDFAIATKRQIDAARRAIEAATFIAEERGRRSVTQSDVEAGIQEALLTEGALTTSIDKRRLLGTRTKVVPGATEACATRLHGPCTAKDFPSRASKPGSEPAVLTETD